MDPGRRSMKSWEDMQACLQRAWKRFTAKTPGLPAELTFEPLNEVLLARSVHLFDSSFSIIIMLIIIFIDLRSRKVFETGTRE